MFIQNLNYAKFMHLPGNLDKNVVYYLLYDKKTVGT